MFFLQVGNFTDLGPQLLLRHIVLDWISRMVEQKYSVQWSCDEAR